MASTKTIHVMIAKVDGPLFDGEAMSVTVPGVEGEMTILISPLRKGVITVHKDDGEEFFEIQEGTLEVSGNRATILM